MSDQTAATDSAPSVSPPARTAREIVVRQPRIDLLGRRSPAQELPGPGHLSPESLPASLPEAPETSAIPRHWWGGDPFKSHFFDAFSSTLPFGEGFFVRSVRHYADRIEDPILRQEIRLFAAQEGQHRRLHDDHVERLVELGYTGLATRNRLVDRILRWHNRRTPAFSLAVTGALEHMTSILARQILHDRGGWVEEMHPDMAHLWRWHALEEAEHKAVAFDVLMQVAPGSLRRNLAMALNTGGLLIEMLDRMIYMFWKDGVLFDVSMWTQGLRFLFGRGGLLRGIGRDYRAWYRSDFHPDEIDDREMIATNAPLVAVEIAS